MHTTTFLVDGTPMPLGVDDLLEYLGQYGNVSTTSGGGIVLGENDVHAIYANLHITFHHGSKHTNGMFSLWEDNKSTPHTDIGEAIRDYLERKEKRAQAVQ